MEIKPIRTEHDHAAALQRIEQLWGSAQGTSAGDELDVLVTLVEAFEREQYPVDLPNPIEAIEFRLEQEGKDYKALIGIIGQRTRVYEVMRGARPRSLNMIRNLHGKLEIPAEVLIQTGPAKKRSRARREQLGSRRSRRRSA